MLKQSSRVTVLLLFVNVRCLIVGASWDQRSKTPDRTPPEETAKQPPVAAVPWSVDHAIQVPEVGDFRRSVALSPAPIPSPRLPSRVSPLMESRPPVDVEVEVPVTPRGDLRDLSSPSTAAALGRMRRQRSRGERTRRRESSLARLRKTGQTLPLFDWTEYFDAGGNRLTRYRSTTPLELPQIPPLDPQIRTADDDELPSSAAVLRAAATSPTSWTGDVVDDERQVEKIVSSRTSTPGKLRSMLVEAGVIDDTKTEPEPPDDAEVDISALPAAKRLSYSVQPTEDEAAPAESDDAVSFQEVRDFLEPAAAVTRASVDPAFAPTFVSALSVPPPPPPAPPPPPPPAPPSSTQQQADVETEIRRIRDSFSSSAVAAAELPSQPSSTSSRTARLHLQRSGQLATGDVLAQPSSSQQVRRSSVLDMSDVPAQPSLSRQARRPSVTDVSDIPAQPSLSRQVRRPSVTDVSDVPLRPSVTKQSAAFDGKRLAPSWGEISKQRMKILGRPPDDSDGDRGPTLQTPLADTDWETVYEEDPRQGSKPYPFYRTPVMPSSLRSPLSPTKPPRRPWVRAPPGGWSQSSQRRYSVPRLSPPKFIRRPVSEASARLIYDCTIFALFPLCKKKIVLHVYCRNCGLGPTVEIQSFCLKIPFIVRLHAIHAERDIVLPILPVCPMPVLYLN